MAAIIFHSHAEKAATLVQGRYLTPTDLAQIVRPIEIIRTLLQNIFKIKPILNVIFTMVSVAMLLAIVLIMNLSLRLRQHEYDD